jgi:hypothetical protein
MGKSKMQTAIERNPGAYGFIGMSAYAAAGMRGTRGATWSEVTT